MVDSKPSHYGSGVKRSPSDEMQLKTRKERRFSATEASLPEVTQHTSYKLLNPLTARATAYSKLTDLLSYLGDKNPLPVPIAGTDEVWLLDNVAFVGPRGNYEAEFVAAVFDQGASCKVIDAVTQVADKLDLAGEQDEEAALARIEGRLMPFLQDIKPGRQVAALHGGSTKLALSPGGRNGISSDLRQVPPAPAGMIVPTTPELPSGAKGLQAKTFFSAVDGWAVISGEDTSAFLGGVFMRGLVWC
jgi:hypothetical protein